mmetsp:Transcript_2671/g.5350  ORF Transcript_2671/g.5350 Transcript_2671/m.5350 type:complete len:226 (+) Transcript_2671:236-913(+)
MGFEVHAAADGAPYELLVGDVEQDKLGQLHPGVPHRRRLLCVAGQAVEDPARLFEVVSADKLDHDLGAQLVAHGLALLLGLLHPPPRGGVVLHRVACRLADRHVLAPQLCHDQLTELAFDAAGGARDRTRDGAVAALLREAGLLVRLALLLGLLGLLVGLGLRLLLRLLLLRFLLRLPLRLLSRLRFRNLPCLLLRIRDRVYRLGLAATHDSQSPLAAERPGGGG